MPVKREELYEAVWSTPAGKAAVKYAVSGSFLARVCEHLNVPRPPRGYWAKLKFGKAPPKPPLPAAKPGDVLEWRRDWMPAARLPPAPPYPPAATGGVRTRVRVPERHPLVWQVQATFEHSRPPRSYYNAPEYLRPYKKTLPDVVVTKERLARALDLANSLYRSLAVHGYRVVLAPDDGHSYTRPFLAYDGKKPTRWEWERPAIWSPQFPTLVFLGNVAIGLTVYEPAEEVESRYVDGKYVPVSQSPLRRRATAYEWTTRRSLPTRRLAIRAYSPYPGTAWEKVWAERSPGRLGTSILKIRDELLEVAPQVSAMAIEAERLRQEEKAREEAERRRRCIEDARRAYSDAVKASRQELLSTIEGWALAMRVERFFEEVERRAGSLTSEDKDAIADRLVKARELLGGVDTLQRLRAWKAPTERLTHEHEALLRAEADECLRGSL